MMMNKICAILFALVFIFPAINGCKSNSDPSWKDKVIAFRKADILKQAEWAMQQQPRTITAFISERSAGGKHDFYSEGDYWWPNPKDPDGPYIRKDGQTNPDNFVAHRHAMIRFSTIVGDLAAAYIVTHDKKYVMQALKHIRAWFVDTATLMNPSLNYAQAIKGRTTGRGIGIIDTIHLIEVAQAIHLFEEAGLIPKNELAAIKSWFADYLQWLMNSKNGQDEMHAENNHGTCWVMQVASFAKVTNDTSIMNFCRKRFKQVLLPNQMATNGSFPREIDRTKPYGYSLFNLDGMATVCQILSDSTHDLWQYKTSNGKSIKEGIQFMYPYVKDKSSWPYPPDVMYWEYWPVAQPFLIFGAVAYSNENYFQLWKKLDHHPEVDEIIRNLPVRHPLIWLK
jgi:hypothetical protein